jgi:hypothetical protein
MKIAGFFAFSAFIPELSETPHNLTFYQVACQGKLPTTQKAPDFVGGLLLRDVA